MAALSVFLNFMGFSEQAGSHTSEGVVLKWITEPWTQRKAVDVEKDVWGELL